MKHEYAKGHAKLGGRVKGTPNKLTASLKEMIRGALDAVGGQKYLEEQARENPTAFMTLLGKLLPSEVSLEHQKAPLSDVDVGTLLFMLEHAEELMKQLDDEVDTGDASTH